MRRLLPLLLLAIFLTACGGSPRPVEIYTGTQGLVVEFAQNAPPEAVLEQTAFPVRVMVRNAGAQDVTYDRFLLMFSTDKLYVTGGLSPYDPSQRDPTPNGEPKTLHGKSLGFPQGEVTAFSMPVENAFRATAVPGQRERPETSIVAGACFAYTTHYSASVCIDTNAYQENLREQPCEAEPIAATGGQGAPISITSVDVQAYPVIDTTLGIEAVRPYFTLTIENVGGGQLVGPDTLELGTACLLQGIPKEQLGAVRVQAYLLSTPLECQPDSIVRLVDGKGEIRCTVPRDELGDPLYASAQNYRSTLLVNLSYLYKVSTQATVAIERSPERSGDAIPLGGRVTGYEYIRAGASVPAVVLPDGEETQLTTTGPVIQDSTGAEWQLLATPEGQAVRSCELYANNPELIPDDKARLRDVLTPDWSCSCGQTRCATLSRSGQCLAGLCPSPTFCCTDVKPQEEPAEAEPGAEPGEEPTGAEASAMSGLATSWPADDMTITSCFGTRNGRTHKGLDIRAATGDPVRAIASGKVELAYTSDSFGKTVVIRHSPSFASRYAHMSELQVAKGQDVQAGDTIGLAGETGNVDAPHLHLETYTGTGTTGAKDPLCFFSQSQLQSASFKDGQNCQSLGYETPAAAAASACRT